MHTCCLFIPASVDVFFSVQSMYRIFDADFSVMRLGKKDKAIRFLGSKAQSARFTLFPTSILNVMARTEQHD